MADAQHLPHGRHQAGDRHLNFHETRDNLVNDAAADIEGHRQAGYRRDAFVWAAFGALAGFGFLNAILGPALPYIRVTEHISYLVGVAHQVAFAVGGGLAGLFATRVVGRPSRAVIIRLGLVSAAVCGLGVGYGDQVAVTVVAALFVSLLGTSACIRLWAALSDAHMMHRVVAMTEGEVSVSLGGILAPLLVGGLASTALSWRFAFVVGAGLVIIAVAISLLVRIPPWMPKPSAEPVHVDAAARSGRLAPTLVVVFAVVALEFALSFWLASYLNDSVGLPRQMAVGMVAGLYAANLGGRVVASRLARHFNTVGVLAASIGVGLVGMPMLLAATGAVVAGLGLVLVGAGIGATFPLTSSLHVAASPRPADTAVGQVLAVAAIGQICGPLAVAGIAQVAGLRVGLFTLPVLAILAVGALTRHHVNIRTQPLA